MSPKQETPGLSLSEALRYWFKLGFVNFGGPAGQIAMLHKNLVEERGVIDNAVFLRALNFCMLLPGPEAHQLAIYLGWRLNGYTGGTAAGIFFVLPSALLMLGLAWLAAAKADAPLVAGVFNGIAAAVVAIVAEAIFKLSKKFLRHRLLYVLAGASFILGQFLGLSFPLIVLLSGLTGLWLARIKPEVFCKTKPGSNECLLEEPAAQENLPPLKHVFKMVALFAAIWALFMLPLLAAAGFSSRISEVALFFSKAPFVTFGGAYAVLAYITDHAAALGWLNEQDILLGLGLAETTPGPLIMVNQFVGFVAAWNAPGGFSPLLAGTLGALATTFATFLPSFMFIFAGAPYIEALTANPKVNAALTGISAAVVGVVLKLGVYFGLATFFPAKGTDFFAIVLAAAAYYGLIRHKLSMHLIIGLSAAAGFVRAMI